MLGAATTMMASSGSGIGIEVVIFITFVVHIALKRLATVVFDVSPILLWSPVATTTTAATVISIPIATIRSGPLVTSGTGLLLRRCIAYVGSALIPGILRIVLLARCSIGIIWREIVVLALGSIVIVVISTVLGRSC